MNSSDDEFSRNQSRFEITGRQQKQVLWRLIDCVSVGAQLKVGGKIGFANILPAFPQGRQLEENIPLFFLA